MAVLAGTWGRLDPKSREKVIELYERRALGPVERQAFNDCAKQLGVKPRSLERYVQLYNQYNNLGEDQLTIDLGVDSSVNTIRINQEMPPPRLSDIEVINLDDDTSDWLLWLKERRETKPEMTVMHPADIHFPFHDMRAIELFIEIVRQVKPDLIVRGSDSADLPLSTPHGTIDPQTKAYVSQFGDDLECFEFHHNWLSDEIEAASPETKQVWIWGNHERWLWRKLSKDAQNMHNTVFKLFVNSIRSNGRVWYLGDVDHVRMGPLVVEHGSRHSMNAARDRLRDEMISIMFGHVHKMNFAEDRGSDFTASVISSGCLCQVYPHYFPRGQSRQSGRKWVQGTAIAQFNLLQYPVDFTNLRFDKYHGELQTRLWGNRLRSTQTKTLALR